MAEGMRLYEGHPITIVGEYAVVRDEAPSFGTGLGDENTVEWILVQFRQGFHCRCVERCHSQLLEASFKEGRAGLFGGYLQL